MITSIVSIDVTLFEIEERKDKYYLMLVYICINTFLTKIQQKHSCQLQSTCLQIVSGLSWHLSLLPLLAILYFFHPQQAPGKCWAGVVGKVSQHVFIGKFQVPGTDLVSKNKVSSSWPTRPEATLLHPHAST